MTYIRFGIDKSRFKLAEGVSFNVVCDWFRRVVDNYDPEKTTAYDSIDDDFLRLISEGFETFIEREPTNENIPNNIPIFSFDREAIKEYWQSVISHTLLIIAIHIATYGRDNLKIDTNDKQFLIYEENYPSHKVPMMVLC